MIVYAQDDDFDFEQVGTEGKLWSAQRRYEKSGCAEMVPFDAIEPAM
jgi:hypothetical protein